MVNKVIQSMHWSVILIINYKVLSMKSCLYAYSLQCGNTPCNQDDLNGQDITVFTSLHACRRVLIFYHQFKAKYIRLHPLVQSKAIEERLKIGCKIDALGCSDNGMCSLLCKV